jgi:hypothetical protein
MTGVPLGQCIKETLLKNQVLVCRNQIVSYWLSQIPAAPVAPRQWRFEG